MNFINGLITGVKDLKFANTVNVYPKKATNTATFNIDVSVGQFTVELYDIQGKQAMSKTRENNRPVSIEALNEGLYFYRLSENQNFYSDKFNLTDPMKQGLNFSPWFGLKMGYRFSWGHSWHKVLFSGINN